MSAARRGSGLTLAGVAGLVGGRVVGDARTEVTGIAPVDEADSSQMAFLATKRYVRWVPDSVAGAFLVGAPMEEFAPEGVPRVVVEDPYPALRTLLQHFFPGTEAVGAVHPTAILGRGVQLGADVGIGPYAVLEADVRVGDHVRVGAHCVVGQGSTIGARTKLYPQVVVYHDSVIGTDVIVHSGVRIGSDGFGYTFADGEHHKMPQVGRAVIEDGVEIGANTTIDRGSLGDTVIGRGVKLDNLVHVAHNVKIGALSLFAALSGVAGSTRLGKHTWVGGKAGIINQLEVGDGARIAAGSTVFRDVPAGETVSGTPARPHREELKRQAHTSRLPKLAARVDWLEAEIRRISDAG